MTQQTLDISELVGAYPVCSTCASLMMLRDAQAEWNIMRGEWSLKSVFDDYKCEGCGDNLPPDWRVETTFRKRRICRLNDEARRGRAPHGSIVVTQGVKELGDDQLAGIAGLVAQFDAFTAENDPHGEHDFGSFEFNDQKIFWKIDPFDLRLKYHSPDAANPDLTHRVLTIMLAEEY